MCAFGGLFFQTKTEAIKALEDLVNVETELNGRLRAVIGRVGCLEQYLDSTRFPEKLGTAPTDDTICLWDWLLKAACSEGVQGMQQLVIAAQRVLLQQTSTYGIDTSTTFLRYLY